MTVIAVVDKQEQVTAVWHVQTAADGPSASGMLSGAWLLGEGGLDLAKLEDLTAGATILPTDEDGLTLAQIHQGLVKQLAELKAAAKEAVAENSSLKLPRFEALSPPDVEKYRAAYRGEEEGRTAWSYAMATAELVEAWHGMESQRRSRKYLQAQFGADIRPLPLP